MTATSQQQKLLRLLSELFQMDRADLDFGIYRVMNQRRDEITAFLENDLLPQARDALGTATEGDAAALKAEMESKRRDLISDGIEPAQSRLFRDLEARYNAAGNPEALEAEVFAHLHTFFSRYYDKGDFISKRRYSRDGKYAIPYDGEEVKLVWANMDQYYIKTTENFRDYAFTTGAGTVHFRIVEAEEQIGNNRPAEENALRFVLRETEPVAEEGDELSIRFEYRATPQGTRQEELNAAAAKTILEAAPPAWAAAMAAKAPTERNPDRTLLEKHLAEYTTRNTSDYFIHKDLGGFLRRELDFYIKNEVMRLDDIENADAPKVESYLRQIKAIRAVAGKIIAFLAQLEDFQKGLWLKKKFVVRTDWLVTLDKVPETLYKTIAANDAQREEWVRLFAIDGIKESTTNIGYSAPLTVAFLKENPFLLVDTTFFDDAFKEELLAAFEDLDEQTNGLLIHSENFQALNLFQDRYRKQVKCTLTDPPYNTSEESFVYKNNYRHSSWMTMMRNSSALAFELLTPDGLFFSSIDDQEVHNLKYVLDDVFGISNLIAPLVIQNNPRGRTIDSFFATCHEYYLTYARDIRESAIDNRDLTADQAAEFNRSDAIGPYRLLPFRRSGGLSTPAERPNSYYPIYFSASQNRIDIKSFEAAMEILPIDSQGKPRVWRQTKPSLMVAVGRGDVVVRQKGDSYTVLLKDRIKDGRKPKSVWIDPSYDASSHGTVLVMDIIGSARQFAYPKSLHAVKDVLALAVKSETGATILDYFAGSGTTGHAVINLNREDDGDRKYLLIEMGAYFDTVLKPRIAKVVYSKDWKDGKPVSREGVSQVIKVLRLESYEDTLNNLAFAERTPEQVDLLENGAVREDFLLHYTMDVDTRASRLDVARFDHPFDYELRIASGVVGETKETVVDLPETFNYLLGLRVTWRKRLRDVLCIEGTSPDGEKVLVLWRDVAKTDNDTLNDFLVKLRVNTRDAEYARIYVNGDNNLQNIRREDESWKVVLIEEEFQRRMFDGTGL